MEAMVPTGACTRSPDAASWRPEKRDSYSNAHDLEQLWQNARFVRITPAGLRESGPHDIVLD